MSVPALPWRLEIYNGVDLLRFLFNSLCHDCCMPRKARIDAAAALQHIICRGIERHKIITDTVNRSNFVARLGRVMVVRW